MTLSLTFMTAAQDGFTRVNTTSFDLFERGVQPTGTVSAGLLTLRDCHLSAAYNWILVNCCALIEDRQEICYAALSSRTIN